MTIDPETLVNPLEILFEQFIRALPGMISAVVVFIVFLYLAALSSRAVVRALEKRAIKAQEISMLSKVTYWSVVIIGLVIALQQVGFNLTAFLAGLGIAGFTIGFALQDVSKNFIAGLLLLLQKPFEIGETIEVIGYTGTVLEIDLRATELRTLDGLLVTIPNANVFTEPITNFSRAEKRRVELIVGVDYQSDPEKVRRVALEAIANIPGLVPDPPPQLLFQNLGNATVDLILYYWVDTVQTTPLAAKDDGLLRIKSAFEREGIEMPYPTQTLYLKQST